MSAIPDLDDQPFDDLVAGAVALLPARAPGWTNHNPSDPGITLIELLAYFTEAMLYRLDRVPAASRLNFLRLLRGPGWDGYAALEQAPAAEVDRAIGAAVARLGEPQCAVTPADFERLACRVAAPDAGHEGGGDRAVRALCMTGADLTAPLDEAGSSSRTGHVSVVVLPAPGMDGARQVGLIAAISRHLQARCLIGTRVHVVGPTFLHVSLRIRIEPDPDAPRPAGQLMHAVADALRQWCGPAPGQGPDGRGWPFGRALTLLELHGVLMRVPGVGSVRRIEVVQVATDERRIAQRQAAVGVQLGAGSTVGVGTRLGTAPEAGAARLVVDRSGRLVAVRLAPHELLQVHVEPDA